MNYDTFIKRFVEQQKLLGIEAQVSKTWANIGRIDLCLPGKFAPFMVVAFRFDDQYNALAYFKPGPRCQYGTGIGCMATGAHRQETFQTHEADEAFSNLMFYAAQAKDNDWNSIPTKGVYIGWSKEMEAAHGAPCR